MTPSELDIKDSLLITLNTKRKLRVEVFQNISNFCSWATSRACTLIGLENNQKGYKTRAVNRSISQRGL